MGPEWFAHGSQMVRKWFADGSGDVRVLSGFGCGSGVVRVWFGCEHPPSAQGQASEILALHQVRGSPVIDHIDVAKCRFIVIWVYGQSL